MYVMHLLPQNVSNQNDGYDFDPYFVRIGTQPHRLGEKLREYGDYIGLHGRQVKLGSLTRARNYTGY